MKILNGREIAEGILANLKSKIAEEKLRPVLGVVLVGENEASRIYVDLKGKAAEKVGIDFRKIKMSENVSEEEVLAEISALNGDSTVNGIIVQLPLPEHLDKIRIIQAIDPKKTWMVSTMKTSSYFFLVRNVSSRFSLGRLCRYCNP